MVSGSAVAEWWRCHLISAPYEVCASNGLERSMFDVAEVEEASACLVQAQMRDDHSPKGRQRADDVSKSLRPSRLPEDYVDWAMPITI